MCYHTSTPGSKDLGKYLGASIQVPEYQAHYHISGFAHPQLPALCMQHTEAITTLSWGLIPSWAKDATAANEIRAKTLNATCEGIFDKPSFKKSIVAKRCLLFVSGFFEWQHAGKEKIPYFIYAADGNPLALGGIWASWVHPETGEVLDTCSIITTPANAPMQYIHNTKQRMPLILPRESWEPWLAPTTTAPALTSLMVPCADSLLGSHRISKLITSRSENSDVPAVQAPLAKLF